MAQPRVTIIGAGIAGLVLGRALLKRGIPAVLYERDGLKPRHSYGISLYATAYRQLLPILDIDEPAFVKWVAVDGPIGGHGRDEKPASFRANRMKLEELLREGLDVRWEHKLKDVHATDQGLSLAFESGQKVESQTVIGADGVHSQVRKVISPNTDFNILSYAVYNGKRRLDAKTFDQKYAQDLAHNTVLTHRSSDVLLQISINERTEDKVSLSYTYSRPAKSRDDPLFRPKRPMSGATDIPQELFTEIDSLQNLKGAFKEVFSPENMKNDRLLNWLMRSILVPESDLHEAAEKSIVLLGDSAYHGPILGSEGANEAIEDAIELAECIASGKDLKRFYQSRYESWRESVQDGEARLAKMHGAAKASL